ncbi:hypothetical protein VD0002_g9758 [Verticillium dahliae]|uniref:Uncharacterized protein n=1 Tax=Verticillium dahliae TaxID=27337 RepID=A0AA44WPA0_VERDA|nr:hypothetical protein BJF96_g3760 [Verticillium dahliae]PNH46404.1 hypothetical protein VD0003_g9024 [Verticillium dahliae]PNH56928.1 hypothetical protein VD0002_g9758 [Verticillium dahliae]
MQGSIRSRAEPDQHAQEDDTRLDVNIFLSARETTVYAGRDRP